MPAFHVEPPANKTVAHSAGIRRQVAENGQQELGNVLDKVGALLESRGVAEVAYAAENERMKTFLKSLERRLVPEHQGALLRTLHPPGQCLATSSD